MATICLYYFSERLSASLTSHYLILQRLFAVIHLSPPCNRVCEKVYHFSVANGWTIGI